MIVTAVYYYREPWWEDFLLSQPTNIQHCSSTYFASTPTVYHALLEGVWDFSVFSVSC